jgi:glycosyltransferase involved in cell wall biosynthesis
LKILIVMPSGKLRGGAEEALIQLGDRRSALPFEMQILFLESGDLVSRLRNAGVVCEVVEAGRLRNPLCFLTALRTTRKIVSRDHCSAVMAWMTKAHLYGGLVARWARIPALVFQMGLPDQGRVDRIARCIPSSGILTCSNFAARMEREVSQTPVLGVPLAMDDARFNTQGLPAMMEAKQRLGFDPARPLVGIVGRLQRWKGMHVFLAAMATLLRSDPAIQSVIVGGPHDLEPGYDDFLQNEARRLGVEGRVRFAGAQSQVQEWMQAMDVVVHASDREPFGIVVVEAMALGKAVVASVPGGPEEIIRNEQDGLLVSSGDPEALAGAVLRFLKDGKLAQRCGDAARVRAGEFTAPRFVQRFSEAVKTLLPQLFPAT